MTITFPSLTTERWLLRPISSQDLPFVFQHFSDPAVGRFLLDDDLVTSHAEAQAIIDFFTELRSDTISAPSPGDRATCRKRSNRFSRLALSTCN